MSTQYMRGNSRAPRPEEVRHVHGIPVSVSCRMASPVESCPGDVNYTSGGTPSINDVRPARRDNVRPPPRAPQRRKRRQRSAEVTCINDRRYCGVYAIAFAVHAALGDDVKHPEFDQTRMRNHLLQCFRKP